jgi:hypothetical protein
MWFQLANVRLTSSNTDSKRLESRSQIINPTAQSVHFRIDTHEAGRWRSSPSEGFEPCEDRRVRAPQRKAGFIDRSRLLDCFSLHLEIDGRIPIGRRYTGVAEPLTYRHDVHARSEQVYGGTVAHAMGVQPLRRQRRHRLSRSRAVLREDVAHAESRESPTAMIDKEWLIGPCLSAVLGEQRMQKLGRLWPERADAFLASLPEETKVRRRLQAKIRDAQRDDLQGVTKIMKARHAPGLGANPSRAQEGPDRMAESRAGIPGSSSSAVPQQRAIRRDRQLPGLANDEILIDFTSGIT